MEPIVWKGDLDDDCSTEFGEWGAHVEAMNAADNNWYCSVYKKRESVKEPSVDIFHSTEHDILPLSGESARRLCELVMRAAVAGIKVFPEI